MCSHLALRKLELHVRALALSIELVKCSPTPSQLPCPLLPACGVQLPAITIIGST